MAPHKQGARRGQRCKAVRRADSATPRPRQLNSVPTIAGRIPVASLRAAALRSRVSVGEELAAEMAALAYGRPDHWSTRAEGIQ